MFVTPQGDGRAAGAGAPKTSASVNLSCCYGEQTCHAASVNLSCCYFRSCKIVGVLGDLANFIGGAGRDAGAGAALHDGMVYQRRKVQALVVVTDLVCSIVLRSEFFFPRPNYKQSFLPWLSSFRVFYLTGGGASG